MSLFCDAVTSYSVSRLRFLFLWPVQVFECVISLVCRLKYPYSCFFSTYPFPCFFSVCIDVVKAVILPYGYLFYALFNIASESLC